MGRSADAPAAGASAGLQGNLGLTKMLAGLYGLPFGLFMAVMTASDLCTANFAMVAIAWFEGKVGGHRAEGGPCCSGGARR